MIKKGSVLYVFITFHSSCYNLYMEYFYNFFDPLTVSLMFKLFWAMMFGVVIGAERLLAHKTAGMRTYALVSMGSALFIIISLQVTNLLQARQILTHFVWQLRLLLVSDSSAQD